MKKTNKQTKVLVGKEKPIIYGVFIARQHFTDLQLKNGAAGSLDKSDFDRLCKK